MEQILIKEKKYAGKYVVIKDFTDPTIISYGSDPKTVYDTAIKSGFSEPVILFVPSQDMVQI